MEKDIIEELNQKVNNLEQQQALCIQALQQLMGQIHMLNQINENIYQANEASTIKIHGIADNLRFELGDPRGAAVDFFYPEIRGAEEAIGLIAEERKSLARFGDGEFAIMCGHKRHSFQEPNQELSQRLIEVLQSENSELLIGIADNYGSLEKYIPEAADEIRAYLRPEIRKEHMKLLKQNRVYYDAYMTRPYYMYRDKYTDAPLNRFQLLQKIWQNRDVIMIEGAQTRLGVGNDLFGNCRSIHRILAPATNSYSRYGGILDAALRYGKKDTLFLIATGPSAGIFAYDLTLEGYQAVDVGHVDVEYEWFRAGTGNREPISYKYTNEIKGSEKAEDILNPVYEGEILERFD